MKGKKGRIEARHKVYRNYANYWYVACPCHPKATKRGYVMEHRLVMEVYLGRFLNSNEVVHHIDGNGLNNDLFNLELFTNSNHARYHALEQWANR